MVAGKDGVLLGRHRHARVCDPEPASEVLAAHTIFPHGPQYLNGTPRFLGRGTAATSMSRRSEGPPDRGTTVVWRSARESTGRKRETGTRTHWLRVRVQSRQVCSQG